MNGETKRILVTVKAYPNLSRKYGETVCVAGIDLHTNQWIRLYPIPFRDLDSDQRFKKYNIIEVKAAKAKNDHRPESYKVDRNTIKVVGSVDYKLNKVNWVERKKAVLPTLSKSMCEILGLSQSESKSLGIFKPKNVSFSWEKVTAEDKKKRQTYYAQQDFLEKKKDPLEAIPYVFRYSFFCAGEKNCQGHTYAIIDWEIAQSFRSWRRRYKTTEKLLEMIEKKWIGMICAPKRDTYFYVGNQLRFRDNFMILGTFYPPKANDLK